MKKARGKRQEARDQRNKIWPRAKIILCLLPLASCLMLLFPVTVRADISIGLIAPITGQYAVNGEQLKRGAEQAVADINAAGGVMGQPLKLEIADDACD